jgi:hypothetical protein
MITLGASDALGIGASTNLVVTYVVEGELVGTQSGAIPAFQVLAQGNAPTGPATIYQPPPAFQALISHIVLYNTSVSPQTVTMYEKGMTTAALGLNGNGWAEYEPNTGWTVYDQTGRPYGGAGGGSTVNSVFTRTGAVVAATGDYTVAQVTGAAPLVSPTFTGSPSAPTPPTGDNSVKLATTAFVAAAGTSGISIYNASQYGISPSNPDNTAALNTLVTNAVATGQGNGTNYAEIQFPAGIYDFTAATTKTSTNLGNAQIPLPVIAAAGQKFQLKFVGVGDGSTLPHWNQTVGQKGGVAFRTHATGTNDATWGEASVIGGPTPQQGYGFANPSTSLFTNLNFQMTGISIVSSSVNPTMCGVDLRGVAEAHIGTLGVFCDAGTSTVNSTNLTNTWVFGLAMPQQNNNDLCMFESYSVEGYFKGLLVDCEHLIGIRVCAVYCGHGIFVNSYGNDFTHDNVIIQASVEACNFAITFNNFCFMRVLSLDTEDGSGPFGLSAHINDAGNFGRGYVGFTSNHEGTNPTCAGVCTGIRIINLSRRGATVNPADVSPLINMPASGVQLLNPFWLDAMVYVVGGTVTAITVASGGFSHAVGTTSGPVLVPSGATIAITYSVAPTWVWTYGQ